MKEFAVKDIQQKNYYFSKTVYLDKSFIIVTPETSLTPELCNTLLKWSFKSINSDGEPQSEYTGGDSSASVSAGSSADSSAASPAASPARSGPIEISQQSDGDKLEKAETFYNGLLSYVENIFVRAAVSDELDFNNVTEKIKDIVEYIKEDRRFLMRILRNREPAPEKNYLATHSVRSTILSIIIGTYIKLPNHRLIELGVAALVHEAGMLKLPSAIYLSQRQLTPHEQKAIITHPILGYSLLKSLDFPTSICLAALEHHERENGTGYPRALLGDKISLYAKIIAVACSYEALSSKRPHKEAKDGYTGMLELLKNDGKRYDDTVVKALVVSLSIYPIGLYVLLSNGKKAQVVDVNPETPRFPVVQVFGDFTPDGKLKTMQTEANVLSIVRPLNRSEIET